MGAVGDAGWVVRWRNRCHPRSGGGVREGSAERGGGRGIRICRRVQMWLNPLEYAPITLTFCALNQNSTKPTAIIIFDFNIMKNYMFIHQM